MRCSKCNNDVDAATGRCGFCSVEAEDVRVISREEIDGYSGMTIDTADRSDKHRSQDGSYRAGMQQKMFFKKVGFGNMSWVNKIAVGLIIAAVLAFILFVALPVIFIVVGIGIVIWMVLSFLRG